MNESDFTIPPVEPHTTTHRYLLPLTIFLLVSVFLIDISVNYRVAIDILFMLPILTALRSPRRSYALYTAVAATCLSLVAHLFFHKHGFFRNLDLNHALGLFTIWVAAAVCVLHIHARRKVWDNQRFIQLAARATPAVQYIYDVPRRRPVYVSCGICSVLGYAPEKAVDGNGALLREIMHPDDDVSWRKQYKDLLRAPDGTVIESDIRMKNSAGSWRQMHWRTIVINRSRDGKPQLIVGIGSDVTEQNKAITALQKSEERFRALYEQAPACYVAMNETGLLIDVNAAWMTTLGYSRDEVIGKSFGEFLLPDDRETFRNRSAELVSKDKAHAVELKLRHADGSVVVVSCEGGTARDSDGRFLQAHCLLFNITERKRAEEERDKLEAQLRQAQKMETIGTLAGGIAHDFNNILTPIMAYTEMAALRLGEGHPQRHDLEHVLVAANRAKDLVKQILTFSRQTEHERIAIELSPVVKEALKLLQASLPSTIKVEANIQTGCGEVLADPSQIHQVLMNLCTNAYHAMREHCGLLTVNLEAVTLTEDIARTIPGLSSGRYVRLTVTDTGCGMDQQTQHRIFEPFFTTKEVGEGTGLGLSVVHGIVASHRGAITVQSEVGMGTAFDVYLPQINATHRTQIVEETAIVGGNEHILVVDDEPEVADVLKDVLEGLLGYTVTVRNSSVDALKLLRAQPNRFDVVITDLTMPHLSGDRLAHEILALRKNLPVILMTGFSETIDEERSRQLGIAGFLLKPPLSADLARMVRKVLDGVPA